MKPPRNPEDNLLSAAFLEGMLAEFAHDPNGVPNDWREYLSSNGHRGGDGAANAVRLAPRFEPAFARPLVLDGEEGAPGAGVRSDETAAALQHRVDRLVWQHRVHGHRAARLDPLGRERPFPAELDPLRNDISAGELDATVVGARGRHRRTVREVIERLRRIYCGPIGVEFMHIGDAEARDWVAAEMEGDRDRSPDAPSRLRMLRRLTDAESFETFLRRKYLGATSFSLEGSESLVALLDRAMEKAGDQGTAEIVIGMAHRGRLNVLANILGKPPREIFREFEDREPRRFRGSGDVRYHLGHSTDWVTAAGERVHLSLCFNPSHLEFVDPVAVGRVRAKQDRVGDLRRERGLALLIHGDASLAGEGVVQETLTLSELPAFRIGGTLHVVVNNQIGFTTSPEESRSSEYATNVAKMIDSPIFHVNGDDPDAVYRAFELAMDFRRRFARDVFIDLYGYRRLGHNEADEPSFTQPLLYRAIREHEPVRAVYARHLVEQGLLTEQEAKALHDECVARLDAALSETRERPRPSGEPEGFLGVWAGYRGGRDAAIDDVSTAVEADAAHRAAADPRARAATGFTCTPSSSAGSPERRAMAAGERPVDWAAAEALAFATPRRRRHAGPPHRTGHRARHVRPASRRPARRRDRGDLAASPAPGGRPSADRDLEQPAVGDGRARLRVRLQPRSSRGAGAVGGAVRRLRQRGAGGHRSVPRRRRGQVAPALGPRAAAAARLRRARTRAFERSTRTLPSTRRRGQHPDRAADHAGPVLPRAAPAGRCVRCASR